MNQTGKKKDCCDDKSHLIYDGSVQTIVKVTETSIGPKFHNICARCSTRFRSDSCSRYSRCVANKDKPGAPWSLPWTKFNGVEVRKWGPDPCLDFDPQSGYLKNKYW